MTLAPARYRPWLKGVYDVSPGLRPLGTDFGNGSLDSDLFQLDGDLARYQLNKAEAIGERKSKYVQEHKLSASVRESVLSLIRTHLKQDFSSLEDAAMRVAEDFAIVSTDRGRDWVSFLHLCSPSHWAAEERIGKSFFDIHRAVPEFERVNAVSTSLVQSMIRRGPFVRFVWESSQTIDLTITRSRHRSGVPTNGTGDHLKQEDFGFERNDKSCGGFRRWMPLYSQFGWAFTKIRRFCQGPN